MANKKGNGEKRKNGEGTFQKLPNGKVRMYKMVGRYENGLPKRITVIGQSETDCIRKMRKKEADMTGNSFAKEQDHSLVELCQNHLDADRHMRDKIKRSSGDRRQCTIDNQIAPYKIAMISYTEVTHIDIRNHMELLLKSKLSVSSIEKTFHIINGAYEWGKTQGIVNNNPCDRIREEYSVRFRELKKRDSASGVVRILDETQEKKILEVAASVWGNGAPRYVAGPAIEFLNETAIRIGELCALQLHNWCPDTQTIDVEKTRHWVTNPEYDKDKEGTVRKRIVMEDIVKNANRRTLEISDKAQVVLRKIKESRPDMEPDDYFFLNDNGNPSEPSAMGSNINRVFEAAGLKGMGISKEDEISGAHIFRRTFATRRYREGERVEDIAAYLGDLPDTVRKHYINLTEKIMEGGKVQNVIRLRKRK